MNHQFIEINKLSKSPLNVRRTVVKGAADDLKASIEAHGGIFHNLVVTESGDGTYQVIDGGRRLEAIQALQAEGKLPADYTVPCQVRSEENALESSLAANTVRLAMHPVDEFEAFARLADAGQPPERIGERFGKPTRHVLQMLRLGNLDPKLLKECRAGNLTLDCLMAFAITDDRKRQMKLFRSLSESRCLNPRAIRAGLTETMAEAGSKLAKFVGLDAYREAGGTIQSDLFSDAVYLENAALLNELAAWKLDAIRRELEAEGWGWVETSQERDWSLVSGCGQIHPALGEVPTELATQREQLEAELAKIEQALEDTESDALTDAYEQAQAKLADIESQIAALAAYDPQEIPFAGCYVTIGHDGTPSIEKGLVRKQDAKRLARLSGEPAQVKPKGMPQTLRRELEAYRLQVAQAEMVRNRLIALDLLIFTAASDAFHRSVRDGVDVLFNSHRPAVKEDTAAGHALKATEKALPTDWLKAKSDAERFRAFTGLSDTQKLDLLAWCVAGSLQPQLGSPQSASAYELGLSLTGADVAGYWRPSVANYLGRITRDQLLELGRSLLGDAWAQSRFRDKKGELAAQLERAFAEPEKHGRTPEQVEKLTRWLPDGMAFTPTAPSQTKKKARKAA